MEPDTFTYIGRATHQSRQVPAPPGRSAGRFAADTDTMSPQPDTHPQWAYNIITDTGALFAAPQPLPPAWFPLTNDEPSEVVAERAAHTWYDQVGTVGWPVAFEIWKNGHHAGTYRVAVRYTPTFTAHPINQGDQHV